MKDNCQVWLRKRLWFEHRVEDTQKAIVLSPVDEAAFSFQSGLVHEPYALFEVLSPVEKNKTKPWILSTVKTCMSFLKETFLSSPTPVFLICMWRRVYFIGGFFSSAWLVKLFFLSYNEHIRMRVCPERRCPISQGCLTYTSHSLAARQLWQGNISVHVHECIFNTVCARPECLERWGRTHVW